MNNIILKIEEEERNYIIRKKDERYICYLIDVKKNYIDISKKLNKNKNRERYITIEECKEKIKEYTLKQNNKAEQSKLRAEKRKRDKEYLLSRTLEEIIIMSIDKYNGIKNVKKELENRLYKQSMEELVFLYKKYKLPIIKKLLLERAQDIEDSYLFEEYKNMQRDTEYYNEQDNFLHFKAEKKLIELRNIFKSIFGNTETEKFKHILNGDYERMDKIICEQRLKNAIRLKNSL